VHALGLRALCEELAKAHEVVVVAPLTEQSAVGHAITLSDPLRVEELEGKGPVKGYGVRGTPADCVKLAVAELLPWRPDMVVSGINQGANVGLNLLYSGTVSAASEAAMLGLKAFAISLDSHASTEFSLAAKVGRWIVEHWEGLGVAEGVALNVNVPAVGAEEIKGLAVARQSQARFTERFVRRSDPRGRLYFWQAGETLADDPEPDSDYALLKAGYITFTPVGHDLTRPQWLEALRGKIPQNIPLK